MKQEIKYTQLDGTELDITIKSLNFKQRNKLLKDYIRVNDFMKASQTKENIDDNNLILQYLKDDVSILDFQYEILEKGLNINVEELEPTDADKLFNENINFILVGGSKN